MGNQVQIIGSRVDSSSQRQYMMDVTDLGAIPISGIINVMEDIPIATIYNNPSWGLVYDSNGNLGSVYQMIGTGSYVNNITWVGYSGVLPGVGSRVTNISEWSVV
ncbi:MAG: hypothetical protein ACTSPI_13775 [Candidatus Heimdallarchaeaceae archaeon]